MRIIRGKYGRRRFNVPTNITARPTTDFARENIFNVIENMVDMEGLRCLDLFAGTGAVSFELLSRGAASVTSVEKSATQARFIEKVKQELGDRNLHLLRTDALRFIRDSQTAFDFVFADPPMTSTASATSPGWCLSRACFIRAASLSSSTRRSLISLHSLTLLTTVPTARSTSPSSKSPRIRNSWDGIFGAHKDGGTRVLFRLIAGGNYLAHKDIRNKRDRSCFISLELNPIV